MPASANITPDPLLTVTPPAVTMAEAVALARQAFGIEAEAEMLASERDVNVRLRTPAGRSYVLKIANAAEDPVVGALQTTALRHIEAHHPALPVPRACPTRDGRFDVTFTLADGTTCQARLVTFLEGEPLASTKPSDAQAGAVGACLAALGLALWEVTDPAAHRDLLWDLRQAPKLRPLIRLIGDERGRGLAQQGLDRYERHVVPRLAGLRTQLVHNDANPHNILVRRDDTRIVAGMLDFGDMVHTALVNDVAVAAAYQVGGDDPLARPLALVAAYHAVSPLLASEIDSLFDLIALRHVQSLTIAEWRAALHPGNAAYILRNHARAAAALDSLDRIGPEVGTARLRAACGLEPAP